MGLYIQLRTMPDMGSGLDGCHRAAVDWAEPKCERHRSRFAERRFMADSVEKVAARAAKKSTSQIGSQTARKHRSRVRGPLKTSQEKRFCRSKDRGGKLIDMRSTAYVASS
jgi:hypothetical protein